MPLRPVNLDESLIGRPLAWNLYTAAGVLVAGAGLVIANAEQLARLGHRPLYREATTGSDDADLVGRLQRLMEAYPATLRDAGTHLLEPALRAQAEELIALAHLDHDACLGLARLLPMRDPAAHHCLVTALVALDLGEPSNLPADSLVAAALTMNVAALNLHADLIAGRRRYDPAVRAELQRHPQAGTELLAAGGIADPVWLNAVREHHENMDGSGYPRGLRDDEIGVAARVLRVADYYASRIRGHRYRPPRSPESAYGHLFGQERGHLDSHLSGLVLRRLGLYPPGTLVRLANREVAVVLRKEGAGDTPGHVTAFMSATGHRLREPVERDTGLINFAVLDITEAEPNWPAIDWPRFWGY